MCTLTYPLYGNVSGGFQVSLLGGVLTQTTIGIPTTETATFDDAAGSK